MVFRVELICSLTLQRIRILRPFDIVNPNSGEIISRETIELRNSLILTENDYNILCEICTQNRPLITKLLDLKCTDIGTFFFRIVKGSKNIGKFSKVYTTRELRPKPK